MRYGVALILLIFNLYLRGQAFIAGNTTTGYFDIIPDTQIVKMYNTTRTFSINMFGNSQPDFVIIAYGHTSYVGPNPIYTDNYFMIQALDSSSFIRYGRTDMVDHNSNIAKPLFLGDTVNSASATWYHQLMLYDASGPGNGGPKNVTDWIGSTDKYIGVKYRTGLDSIYGWIRVNLPNNSICTIKDYSALGVGIAEQPVINFETFPNPVSDHLYVSGPKSSEIISDQIYLTDFTGRNQKCFSEMQTKTLKVHVPNNLPFGLYFLSFVMNDGSHFVKKIIYAGN